MNHEEKYRRIYEAKDYGELRGKDALLGIYESKDDYFYKLARRRAQIVMKYYNGGEVLDVCAGNGAYMYMLAPYIEKIFGIEFQKKAVEDLNAYFENNNVTNALEIEADARKIPFDDSTFAVSYCFSSLYDIPEFERVICEMTRVTQREGIVILDLGNKRSINSIISSYYTKTRGLPETTYLSDYEIDVLLKNCHIEPIEILHFQLFPYWGNHPSFLRFFCGKRMNHIMGKEINGRMLDEIISNFPFIKKYAFRRIVVCRNRCDI